MAVIIKLSGVYIGETTMDISEIRKAEKEGFTIVKKENNNIKGGNNMINIIYNNEIIDTANSIKEALYLKKEDEIAFHTNNIEIEINF